MKKITEENKFLTNDLKEQIFQVGIMRQNFASRLDADHLNQKLVNPDSNQNLALSATKEPQEEAGSRRNIFKIVRYEPHSGTTCAVTLANSPNQTDAAASVDS